MFILCQCWMIYLDTVTLIIYHLNLDNLDGSKVAQVIQIVISRYVKWMLFENQGKYTE